jgi:hypothetical protein
VRDRARVQANEGKRDARVEGEDREKMAGRRRRRGRRLWRRARSRGGGKISDREVQAPTVPCTISHSAPPSTHGMTDARGARRRMQRRASDAHGAGGAVLIFEDVTNDLICLAHPLDLASRFFDTFGTF